MNCTPGKKISNYHENRLLVAESKAHDRRLRAPTANEKAARQAAEQEAAAARVRDECKAQCARDYEVSGQWNRGPYAECANDCQGTYNFSKGGGGGLGIWDKKTDSAHAKHWRPPTEKEKAARKEAAAARIRDDCKAQCARDHEVLGRWNAGPYAECANGCQATYNFTSGRFSGGPGYGMWGKKTDTSHLAGSKTQTKDGENGVALIAAFLKSKNLQKFVQDYQMKHAHCSGAACDKYWRHVAETVWQ